MGLLDGKKGLILNIANDRSIAWHIACCAIREGAKCGFGYLPQRVAASLRREP
jgi:enoyl-[acyl-carrier protein] reductase I